MRSASPSRALASTPVDRAQRLTAVYSELPPSSTSTFKHSMRSFLKSSAYCACCVAVLLVWAKQILCVFGSTPIEHRTQNPSFKVGQAGRG